MVAQNIYIHSVQKKFVNVIRKKQSEYDFRLNDEEKYYPGKMNNL